MGNAYKNRKEGVAGCCLLLNFFWVVLFLSLQNLHHSRGLAPLIFEAGGASFQEKCKDLYNIGSLLGQIEELESEHKMTKSLQKYCVRSDLNIPTTQYCENGPSQKLNLWDLLNIFKESMNLIFWDYMRITAFFGIFGIFHWGGGEKEIGCSRMKSKTNKTIKNNYSAMIVWLFLFIVIIFFFFFV